MKKINPKLIVIIGVVFVSFSSVLIKASSAPALIISTYRLAFTVLMIAPATMMKHREELKNIDRKSLLLCALSGMFLALHFATWITSIKYTSIASSAVLVNTHPIFIVVLAYFIFKDKVNKRALFSISLTLIGGIIISSGDSGLGSNVFLGDMLAVAGAAFVSFYMIIGRIMRKRLSVTAYTFIVYLSCTITLLLLDIITRTPLYPYALKDFAIFLGLALFCTILGHSIFSWALEHIKPTFLSVAILGEPVFATVWAALIFSEFPTYYNLIGSTIIIIGIYLFSKAEGK
ncbi:DMT family transporter [Clostridium swellfunianum]|uniref:DMT family transporter n=1 Tax=Clostridium swellfunianum TaxID=1367462 RepID=UPI00202F5E9B|nr:DMT family transporter [Clostridium swellfunianum]MCM0648327.1 DMT family transporter [Clostridium swellfunianum]